ncbi:MAG: CobW family GTP-binding protein [Moorellaceae bacterium]
MKIILISGFLGSGKTTFIRHWGAFLVQERGLKVVVLENEVGEVGIDDQFLARQGFRVKGIYGGCICCQLTGELVAAVNQIATEMQPDYLIIEATGLARPETVLKTLREYGNKEALRARVIVVTLVDASRWQELFEIMPELISAQIASAELVLINKVDELEGNLAELETKIREVNTRARIAAVILREGVDPALLKELN